MDTEFGGLILRCDECGLWDWDNWAGHRHWDECNKKHSWTWVWPENLPVSSRPGYMDECQRLRRVHGR